MEQATVAGDKCYRLFERADIRFNDQTTHFADEYAEINQRRQHNRLAEQQNPGKPDNLIGLGLSGGGVKASAFHLGLLSGLHQAGLLSRIDYIASVSGGSWANGAYWACHETDGDLFACLDSITHAKYSDSNNLSEADKHDIYRCKKYLAFLPNEQNSFLGSRDWQRHIRATYLLNDDIIFSDFLKYDKGHLTNKPFPVFLATHTNKMLERKHEENYPFEITPLGFGTVADLETEIEGEKPSFLRRWLRPHLWCFPPEKGFYIDNKPEGNIEVKVQKYCWDKEEIGLRLSHSMWASGRLFAKILSMHLGINQNGNKISGIKQKYVLSDGGKSDNTGLTPLMERGVDLIVLSHIASDSDLKFRDIDIASKQVKRLFGVDMNADKLKQKDDQGRQLLISESTYDNGKNILLVKPTPENIEDFYNAKNYSKNKFVEYLRTHEKPKTAKDKFPQNPTIDPSYEQELIYGYYLLGRFIGNEKLANKIKQKSPG
jgi:predicted acylesterase/phospholipase RssA